MAHKGNLSQHAGVLALDDGLDDLKLLAVKDGPVELYLEARKAGGPAAEIIAALFDEGARAPEAPVGGGDDVVDALEVTGMGVEREDV